MTNRKVAGLTALLLPISIFAGDKLSRIFTDSQAEIKTECTYTQYTGDCGMASICKYIVNYEGKTIYQGSERIKHPMQTGDHCT